MQPSQRPSTNLSPDSVLRVYEDEKYNPNTTTKEDML